MSLEFTNTTLRDNITSSSFDFSHVPMKTLEHIAIWKKSVKICNKHHPGKPPCFFPVQFSLRTIPQKPDTLPVFVQQCPSCKLYKKFTKALLIKPLDSIYHDDKLVSSKFLFLPSPDSSHSREVTITEGLSPQTPLSSVYSCGRLLIRSTKLLYSRIPNYSIWSDYSYTNEYTVKSDLVVKSRNDSQACKKSAIPLTSLSALKPMDAKEEYLALHLNQQSWEFASYSLIRSFTVEIRNLIALVNEDMESEQ